MKSKFCECPDFSCSRSDGTLEPVTSSFPAASESLRANSQSSAVVQPVRPLSRSFSPVRVQSGKTRCHSDKENPGSCNWNTEGQARTKKHIGKFSGRIREMRVKLSSPKYVSKLGLQMRARIFFQCLFGE